jgi:hypothetical protein
MEANSDHFDTLVSQIVNWTLAKNGQVEHGKPAE